MELKRKNWTFSKRVILQALGEVEAGFSRKEVAEKYGITYPTLTHWLSKYGGESYQKNKRVFLSDHQKRVIIKGVEDGVMTIKEACLAYGIKDRSTIRDWIKSSKQDIDHIDSNESSMPTSNIVFPDLKKALDQANLKVLALETLIDVAEEQLKIKIRKKPGAKQ
jgi:transposase-like protein